MQQVRAGGRSSEKRPAVIALSHEYATRSMARLPLQESGPLISAQRLHKSVALSPAAILVIVVVGVAKTCAAARRSSACQLMEASAVGSWDAVKMAMLAFAHTFYWDFYHRTPGSRRPRAWCSGSCDVIRCYFRTAFDVRVGWDTKHQSHRTGSGKRPSATAVHTHV